MKRKEVRNLESFIGIILFSIPGLLVYFWVQLFGINPTVKHLPTEQAAIAALFWVPTVLLSLITYNIAYFIVDHLLLFLNFNWSNLGLKPVFSLKAIEESSTNLLFIFYFFILSIVFSYVIAVTWTNFFYMKVIDHVNEVRIKRKFSKLDDTTSVWDAFFLKVTSDKEEPLVVEISKLDSSKGEKLVGSATKFSRPYEADKAIVLENIDNNRISHEYYQYQTKRIYFDLKSGLVVSELDTTKPTKNIEDFTSFLEEVEAEQQDD